MTTAGIKFSLCKGAINGRGAKNNGEVGERIRREREERIKKG